QRSRGSSVRSSPLVKSKRAPTLLGVRFGIRGGSGDFPLGETKQLNRFYPVTAKLRLLEVIRRRELAFGGLNRPHRSLQMRMLSPLDRQRCAGHNHAQGDQQRSLHFVSSFLGGPSPDGTVHWQGSRPAVIPSRRTP